MNIIEQEMMTLALRIATEAKQEGVNPVGIVNYHSRQLVERLAEEIAVELSVTVKQRDEFKKKIKEMF